MSAQEARFLLPRSLQLGLREVRSLLWFLPLLTESRVSQYTCYRQNPWEHYEVTIQPTVTFWSHSLSWILRFLVWCWKQTHTHRHTQSFTRSFLSSLSSYFLSFPSFPSSLLSPYFSPCSLSICLYLFFLSPSFCFLFLPLIFSFFTFFSFGRSTGEVQETPYCQTRVLQGTPIASNIQGWWETLKGWHAPRTSWKCVAAAKSRRRCLPLGWFWVEAPEVVGGV